MAPTPAPTPFSVEVTCPAVYDAMITCYNNAYWKGLNTDDDGYTVDADLKVEVIFDLCDTAWTYDQCEDLLSTDFDWPQWLIDACPEE